MKKCHINPKYANEPRLQTFLETLPASFADSGTMVWNGRNKIKIFSLPSQSDDSEELCIVAKRFKRLNFLQKQIYAIRRNKALRAFLNGMELCRRGIDTPEPIACVEIKQGPWIKDAFYLSGKTTLQSIEAQVDRPDWNRDLAKAFARFAATLHDKGILHNDLNDTNVLYRQDEAGNFHFSVIDINRMKFCQPTHHISDKKCIENLTRFTGRIDLFAFVAREYAKVRGLDTTHWVAKAVRQKDRHDYKWRWRKAVLHPIRHIRKMSARNKTA